MVSLTKEPRLKSFDLSAGENVVGVNYSDGETVLVSKKDYDRAFGTMINASKAEVIRDYAIKKEV